MGARAIRYSFVLSVLAIALESTAAPPTPAPAAEQLDWCAPVVVRPLRRWLDRRTCTQPFRLEEIAAGADLVLMGGSDLPAGSSESGSSGDDPCKVPQTRATHAAYLGRLRAEAAKNGRRVLSALMTRFDLVGPRLAARPGFEPGFLVRSGSSWERLLAFFRDDESPACRGGCRFTTGVRYADRTKPDRIEALMAQVDLLEGEVGAARSYVYYLSRSRPGMRDFHATRALADLQDPRYRAWRAAEARRALDLGGYDAVVLNHKFHQYAKRGSPSGHWLGSGAAPDVEALNRLRDTLWTAPPVSYEYTDYVRGWRDLAGDLRAAGVPYAVQLPIAVWGGSGYDDPGTPEDESAWIREVARQASLVLLHERTRRRGSEFDAVRAGLEGAGVRVIPVDASCAAGGGAADD